MFMERNRRLNGAASPESTASSDESAQRAELMLSTNNVDLGSPQRRTFQPQLSTQEEISRRRVRANVEGKGWDGPSYEQHIPVGTHMGMGRAD